ncbi:hypothetical protein [Streptomyces sp. TLI_146]|uniref:hypothetical protein n=1 Tax=Streptomyces sp. TLI_146 TaxID=1938858 RepID=UPI00214B8028|nr:hypothetical protein [Streptomyces sp. TLI_146]
MNLGEGVTGLCVVPLALASDEDESDFWGFAHGAEGFFTPVPGEDGARRVRLEGCLPQGGLLKSVGHIGRRRAMAGNAWLDLLNGDGAAMGSYFVGEVTVIGVTPSAQAQPDSSTSR